MRATLRLSASETRTVPLNFFLTFLVLEVRMWRFLVWPRRIFPVAVFLKRLAAPLWVFNLGMVFLLALRVNNFSHYTGETGRALPEGCPKEKRQKAPCCRKYPGGGRDSIDACKTSIRFSLFEPISNNALYQGTTSVVP